MIQSPRLLDKDLQCTAVLPPLQYSLSDKFTPLSTASVVLPYAAPDVPMRAFVELYDEHGSVGVYRVANIREEGGGVRTYALQHGLCTLSDHMHPGESTDTGSCRTLLTKILSNQTRWTLGTVDVPDDEDMTWECSNTNDLQGLLGIVKELPGYFLDFDMTGTPWVLHLRAKSTEVDCEARIDRNVVDVQIEYDATEMCTVAYADGLDSPIRADTCDEWDEIVRHVSADEDLSAELITQTVERYLEQNKNPRATITITALELSRLTGEPYDRFRKGMLCRCILENRTLIQRIETIERPDVIGEPEQVVLTLASTSNDLGVTVAGLVVDTRHMNQLYQQLDKRLRIEAETIDMIADEIRLYAYRTEVDIISDRVNTVEVNLDAFNAELLLKASVTDMEDVYLRLDGMDSVLEAKADLILLDGYVTMAEYEAGIAEIETTFADYIMTGEIDAGTGEFGTLIVTGSAAIPQLSAGSIEINGSAAATQEWVEEQGYLTYIPSTYATQSWVIDRGYATSSDVAATLTNFVMHAELETRSQYVVTSVTKIVNSAGYVTDVSYSGTTITYYA